MNEGVYLDKITFLTMSTKALWPRYEALISKCKALDTENEILRGRKSRIQKEKSLAQITIEENVRRDLEQHLRNVQHGSERHKSTYQFVYKLISLWWHTKKLKETFTADGLKDKHWNETPESTLSKNTIVRWHTVLRACWIRENENFDRFYRMAKFVRSHPNDDFDDSPTL